MKKVDFIDIHDIVNLIIHILSEWTICKQLTVINGDLNMQTNDTWCNGCLTRGFPLLQRHINLTNKIDASFANHFALLFWYLALTICKMFWQEEMERLAENYINQIERHCIMWWDCLTEQIDGFVLNPLLWNGNCSFVILGC